MKKLLSILGTIGLTATSTTSLISCEKPNNNENGGNKPEPEQPQQPPKDSNWKLVDNIFYINTLSNDGKIYIGIFKGETKNEPKWNITNWKNIIGEGKTWIHAYKAVYSWNGDGEPEIPEINPNTGEILDWKG